MTLPPEDKLPADIARALLDSLSTGAAAPPAGLRARVLREVQCASLLAPAIVTLRADDAPWTPIFPGVELKVLQDDGVFMTCLARMAPGGVLPAHHHDRAEECWVVSGSVQSGGQLLHAGDYQLAAAGTMHSDVTTTTGCTVLLRTASFRSPTAQC